jgi:hypothetical protein
MFDSTAIAAWRIALLFVRNKIAHVSAPNAQIATP